MCWFRNKIRQTRWREILPGALLVFISVWGGRAYLTPVEGRTSPIALEIYIYRPAIMLAGGRGFYEPDQSAFPEANGFLRGQLASLDPAEWPETIPRDSSPYTHASEYHLYLNYTVALFWRLFGISHESLEPLAIALLCWTALAAYGIMRLGMGKILSFLLALAFTFSPPVLLLLPSLRDFSKAPFLLSLIFALGYLVHYCRNSKALLFWAIALGVLHGVAMGFRQDALIFTPLVLVVLVAVSALIYRPHGVTKKQNRALRICFMLPLCLYSLLFLLFSWPMLGRMEGGADPYWPLVQGFSARHMQNLGIAPGAYIPHASAHDNYTTNMLYHYYRRANNEPNAHFDAHSPTEQAAGRQWLLAMGAHFPADLLLRGYASVFRLLRYADVFAPYNLVSRHNFFNAVKRWHLVFGAHMHRFGLLYGALALLLISGHSLPLALGIFLFCLYLCGYVSLQSELRHGFHLSVLPFWVVGFLASQLGRGARLLRTHVWRPQSSSLPTSAEWRAALIRMAVFSVCVLLMTVPPLWTLRLYQRYTAHAVFAPCVQAERVSRTHTTHEAFGWTLFDMREVHGEAVRPQRDLEALYQVVAAMFPYKRARYIVVEFDGNQAPDLLLVRYDPTHSWRHFSQLVRLPKITHPSGSVFHAFPVYKSFDIVAWSQFKGIALPKNQAAGFKGFHEVLDVWPLRFLMHLTWAGEDDFSKPPLGGASSRLPLYQRIELFPDPLYYELAPHFVEFYENAADRAVLWKRYDTARLWYGLRLLFPAGPDHQIKLGWKLLDVGSLEGALEAARPCTECDAPCQEDRARLLHKVAVRYMAQYMDEQDAPSLASAHEALASLAEAEADNVPELLLQGADQFSKQGLLADAHGLYRKFMLAYPEHEQGADKVSAFLDNFKENDAVDFWREITQSRHWATMPWLRLGMALERADRREEAGTAYATAIERSPGWPHAVIGYLSTVGDARDAETVIALANDVVEKHPQFTNLIAHHVKTIADAHALQEDHPQAAILYAAAVKYTPDNTEYRLAMAYALAASGDAHKARTAFESLLSTEAEGIALFELEQLLTHYLTPEERMEAWEQLRRIHPENIHVCWRLVLAQWETGNYATAASELESLAQQDAPIPDLSVWRHVASLAAGAITTADIAALSDTPEQAALSRRLLREAASVLFAAGHAIRAETLTRAAMTLAPEDLETQLTLGKSLESQGLYDEALRLYIGTYANTSEKELVATAIDALCERTSRQHSCLGIWRELTEAHPRDAVAWRHLGITYEKKETWTEAAKAYRRALDLDPDNKDAKLQLARTLLAMNQISESIGIAARLVEEHEDMASATAVLLIEAAAGLLAENRADEALQVCRLAVTFAPEEPFAWIRLGDAHALREENTAAKDAWREAVMRAPDGPITAEAARRLHETINDEQHLEFWRDISNETPEAVTPIIHYARALSRTGQPAQALDLIKPLRRRHPDHEELSLSHGLLSCQCGDIEAGLTIINGVTAVRSDLTAEAARELAAIAELISNDEGKQHHVEQLLRAATAMAPKDPRYNALLGNTLYAQHKIDKAVEQFIRVLMVAPESPRVAIMMDEAYAQLNAPEECRHTWEMIVKEHPEAQLPLLHLQKHLP